MINNHQELDMVDTEKKYKTSTSTTRLHINIGKTQGFSPRHLLSAIFQETGLSKKLIGNIDVFDAFTFMEVQSDYADTVIEGLSGKKLKGQKVRVERASEKKKKRK
jgi:ATP-dependent RNA helicase DeaD